MKIFTILAFSLLFLSGCVLSSPVTPDKKVQNRTGVTADQLRLGSSAALTGHAGYLGENYLIGAQAYFAEINQQGGVHGRSIEVISYDDQYDPPRCVANTQKLINDDKVFALFNYVGTPTSQKIAPMLPEADIPLVGLFTGAHELREPVQRHIFNIRGSYYLETSRAVKYFVEDLGLSRIAVFYQNDAYGLDGLKGAEKALLERGMEIVASASYVRGTMEVEAAAQVIQDSGAEAVIMVGTYSPCAQFVKILRQQAFEPYFHAVSFIGGNRFAEVLGDYGEGVIVSQVVPPPDSATLSGARLYRELMAKHFPTARVNFTGFEGFINAMVIVEGLKGAGPDLTRDKFISALESLRDYSAGIGPTISFGATDHSGLEHIFFTVIREGQLKLFTDWSEVRK